MEVSVQEKERKLFHRRARKVRKSYEYLNYFWPARANRHWLYHEMKSGRARLRIISLAKRSSQKESGFRFSR